MLSEALQYQRDAVNAGQWWRFATASFVHWSWDQVMWDGIAFVVLALIAARLWRVRFFVAFVVSAIAIPLFVHFFVRGVDTYRGLSGVDSALFALVAIRIGGQAKAPVLHWICFVAFASKIAFEMFSGSTMFVRELAPGVASLPVAHLVGAAIGVVAALLPELRLQCMQLFDQRSDRILESLHAYGEWFSG